MKITLPDSSIKEFPGPVTPKEVALSIGAGLAKAAIGARVDGQLWDLHRRIDHDARIAIVTRPKIGKDGRSQFRDEQHQKDALYLLRHSCAHVMAEAICKLFPKAQLAYGPPLDNGFYYDIYLGEESVSTERFAAIEEEMKQIVAADRPFTRYEMPAARGLEKLQAEGNKYKIDNAQRALEGGSPALSWYVTGQPQTATVDAPPFEDLCMGPHIPSTGVIGAFKVMSVASSNWHGDVKSDRFVRVYGTAFFTKEDLDAYLAQVEEAKARDHRAIGPRLGLFTVDEQVGQGLILWKPKGAILRQQLQNFISAHLQRQGYSQVFTPNVGKLGLFKTSGHFPYYQDKQYPPMIDHEQLKHLAQEGCTCAQLANRMRAGDIDGYLLKPMNCPFHIKIYASELRSYRDLPIRLAEFGTVYRWEQSGEIGGMTRVRGFTQDDAHLFVTPEQVDEELRGCLELVKIVFTTLGMTDYRVRVGLRDPDKSKFVGEPALWDQAEAACQRAAQSLGVPFAAEPGEAAFYGPKIDFVVKDIIGREWQLGTVQVDYQLPIRFDLSYIGPDNQPHRPVMIHRAPFGSMERFIGVLIEHFAGAFPLWLAPEQLRILPISDKFAAYGQKVLAAAQQAGFRATIDQTGERINAKVKLAQEDKVPYMLVVGGKDEAAGQVSVRCRSRGDLGALALADFVAQARQEAATYGQQQLGKNR